MNSREKILKEKILGDLGGELELATSSLSIQAVLGGRKIIDLKMGKSYQYYDLASLTKILFTVPAIMLLVDRKQIKLSDEISKYLSWWPHKKVRIEQVLSHSAGLPWWAPFYKKLDLKAAIADKRKHLQKMLAKTQLTGEKQAIYSDLDFILLGFLIEEIYGQKLQDIWQELPFHKNLKSLHFNLNNKPLKKRNLYAPTEKCPWRHKTLQGEVHDDNTWSFGGVSTHAGLFGAIDDVTDFGLQMRQAYRNKSNPLASHKTLRKFAKRAVPPKIGDWALGFMLPTKGQASCGEYFHSTSFGHTGFTGTSLWYDPKRDLLVTILANRVHPTRDNRRFVALRPRIHDFIVEGI